MFIVIMTTTIISLRDIDLIKRRMDELIGDQNWSIDLGDDVKILRILISSNLLKEVYSLMNKRGFSLGLLNIYHCDYGVEYPLLSEEGSISGMTFVSYSLYHIFFC